MDQRREYAIGERLKIRRNELNLTLQSLSERSGIAPQLISDYENGRKEPGVKNIKLLCKALGIYSNYLLDEDFVPQSGKINTLGNALRFYFEALDISKEDRIVIDEENGKVSIEINNDTLQKALIQSKGFIEIPGEMGQAFKNFNIDILSHIEVGE